MSAHRKQCESAVGSHTPEVLSNKCFLLLLIQNLQVNSCSQTFPSHLGPVLILQSEHHLSNLPSESNRCIHSTGVGEGFLCPHSLPLKWFGAAWCIEPLLIHLWPTDQKYSWKWQPRLASIVYSLLTQDRSMATDSNMTSRQNTFSSINDWAARLRIVNKGTDM